MDTIIITVLIVLSILSLLFGGLYLLRGVKSLAFSVDYNTSEVALKKMLKILLYTKNDLFIYDDGNKMEKTIYDAPKVLEKIKSLFDENKNFKLRVLFNSKEQEPVALISLLKTLEKEGKDICIDYREENDDIDIDRNHHFKIADGGCIVFESKHEFCEEKRAYKLDFTYKKYRLLQKNPSFEKILKSRVSLEEKYFSNKKIKSQQVTF